MLGNKGCVVGFVWYSSSCYGHFSSMCMKYNHICVRFSTEYVNHQDLTTVPLVFKYF
jgi:methyl coenzyme M reductase beta subunit